MHDARALFTWMLKVIRLRFGFAFLLFLFCTETLAPLAIARPIRGKANQSCLAHARFPALHADHVVTLRFDWFTWLSVSFVTGYFVLDFDIEQKISLCSSCCIVTIFFYLRDLYGKTTNFGFAKLTFLSLGQYTKSEDRTFEVDT